MKMPTTAAAATTTSRFERMRAALKRTRALSVACVAVAALVLLLGCANKQQAEASASVARVLPDIAEPSGLLGELSIGHPALSYKALRDLGGPLAGLLPAGFPLLVTNVLGLPPLAADSFDAQLPVFGLLVQNTGGAPGWVFAVHAVSGPELVAKLSTGDHAPFRAASASSAGLTLLQPAAAPGMEPTPLRFPLAVFDNYLLTASSADVLLAAGPYAARMPPKHPLPAAAVALRFSKQALTSRVVPALRGLWANYRISLSHADELLRSAHGGRAPDFADPAQIILGADTVVESALSLIDEASALELDVEPFADRLEATLLLQPEAGSAAQSTVTALTAGTAQPLSSLPAATRFALGFARTPADRDAAGNAAGDDWARLFGARLSDAGAKQLRSALADWELGRGTQTSYGFIAGSEPGAYLVTDVGDATRLKRCGSELFGLLALPGLRAPVTEFIGRPQLTDGVAPKASPLANVSHTQLTFAPGPGQKANIPALSFAWLVDEKFGFAAAGKNADPLLQQVVASARGQADTLASKASIAPAVQRMGDHVALYVYLDARVGLAPDSAEPAPVLVGVGQRAGAGYVRIEFAQSAIDLALHSAVGL